KGLEFPIVILGAMEKEFNFMDLNKKYLLHKDDGFATKFIDPIKRISYTTLYYEAVRIQKLREQLAEEMRVLYVALTRAKEKLVMIGNVNSIEKKREDWQQVLDYEDWVLPEYYRVKVKNYLDWVAPALMRHKQNDLLHEGYFSEAVLPEIQEDPSKWKVAVIHAGTLTNLEAADKKDDRELETYIESWTPVP